MNAKVLAVVNQKGGVGKTTTSVNLAAALSQLKTKVLLLDLDPQGNATMGSGVDKYQLGSSMNEVFSGNSSMVSALALSSVIIETPFGYALAPANADLTEAEVVLIKAQDQKKGQEKKLSEALKAVKKDFDWILIDCPPTLSMLTVNALVAADGVLIPMQCEYYALEGLTALLATIEQIQAIKSSCSGLKIWGIVRTMHDARNKLSADVGRQLEEHFGSTLLRTVIPRNVRIAEAPSYGMPALFYEPKSKGAVAYLGLAKELIKNRKKTEVGIQKMQKVI